MTPPMQFPAANAAPFEFARPILLLAAFAFFVGFCGYLAVHPAPVSVAGASVQAIQTHAPATVVSTPPADLVTDRPEKT